MARPRMIVVAGPPGSGKTRYFPVTAIGVASFNIDDRCAQILGSYRAIPRDVRRAVAKECERFVLDHIERRCPPDRLLPDASGSVRGCARSDCSGGFETRS